MSQNNLATPCCLQGGTYGGSALGMAAIKATIDVIEGEGLLDNVKERGLQLMKGLMDLAKVSTQPQPQQSAALH